MYNYTLRPISIILMGNYHCVKCRVSLDHFSSIEKSRQYSCSEHLYVAIKDRTPMKIVCKDYNGTHDGCRHNFKYRFTCCV
jgi:hypothetical protein